MEDIKIIDDLAPRRRRGVPPPASGTKPPPEANSTKDGDLGVHPPADYYDDIFAKLLGLVGELLGRAAVAAITWLWAVLDWLGAAILGAWWARLKWVSMIMIGAVLLAGIAVLCVVAWVAVRSAVRACKWALQLLKRFSTGEVSAHEVRVAAGDPQVRPFCWRGVGCEEPFSAAYIAEVKGRGENRLPYDVLVKVDGGVARLTRGQLKGRVARHGYTYFFHDIKGCSHRGLRQRLEGTRSGDDGSIHLCSQAGCAYGEAGTIHVPLSAVIDGGAACDVAELARHGPLRRFCMGGRLLKRLCCACRSAKWCRRAPARLSQRKPDAPPRILDPLSESESEPNDEPCEADKVAYHASGTTVLLSAARCRDAAAASPTTVLEEDADISDLVRNDEGLFEVHVCLHHGQVYDAQASRRKCAKESCFREGRADKDGFRLCAIHAAATRVRPAAQAALPRRRSTSEARPRFADEGADTEPTKTIEDKRGEQWVAYVRDPSAGMLEGWSAYYRFPAKVTVDSSVREGSGGDGFALVSVEELVARYEVPVACLYPVQRGWEEFLATRPPVVCKRMQIPAGAWVGTNDEGRPMPVAAIAAVARGSAEGQGLHRFGRRVNSVGSPTTEESDLLGVAGAWSRGPPRTDAKLSAECDPLAEWASRVCAGTAAQDLLDDYLRARVKGMSDCDARITLITEDRGQGETLGLLMEEAEKRCHGLRGQGGFAERQEELLRATILEWRRQLGEGEVGDDGWAMTRAAPAHPPAGSVHHAPYPGAAARSSSAAGWPPQGFSGEVGAPPGLPASSSGVHAAAAAGAPLGEDLGGLDPQRGRTRSVGIGAGRSGMAPVAFFGRSVASQPPVPGQAPWAPSAEARGLAATRAWHAGAFTGPTGTDAPFAGAEVRGVEASLRDLVKEMNRSNRHAEDSAGAAKGTLASIGRVEGQLVFLARACDHLTVTLCVHVLEKEAFHALRAAGVNMRPLMRTIKFPTNITNSIAYGYAALQHGGRCHESLPDYALSSASFPHTTEADMDRYAPPKDYKLEGRPRHASTLSVWFRDALRESWAWGCFYGQEHYPEQERAAQYLLDLGEKHDYAWPPKVIFGVWCELRWRWCEELRMTRQRMLELMGDESPTYDRIRFVCTAPQADGTPWLQLPDTYSLEKPTTYFTTDIKVRHENMLTRASWAMAFQSAKVNPGARKAGEDDADRAPPKAGEAPRGRAANSSTGEQPKTGQVFNKLLGEPLLKSENGRSLDHRPKSPGGKYICWDHSCWAGCARKICLHSHKDLGKPSTLDRTVQMQLVRRGGHRATPKVKGAEEADQKIAALRKQQEQEDASKRKSPDKKSGECRRDSTFAPPSELVDVQTTDLEEDLRRLMSGPSTAWQEDHHPAARARATLEDELPDEARRRRDAMAAIDASASLRPAAEAKGAFGVFIRNRLRQLYEEQPGTDPQRAMKELALEAVAYGAPETADGATGFLDEYFGKVGSVSQEDAFVGPVDWAADGSVGIGNMRWRGNDWTMYDYKDRLHLDENFVETLLGVPREGEPATEEMRACAVIHVAAGVLMAETGSQPDAADVQKLAAEMRIELTGQAARAMDAMGDLPTMVNQAEADLRVYCHDLLFRDHDKDYRTYAAFPLPALATKALMTVRVDYYGGVTLEAIPGAQFDPEHGDVVWLLIHRGHMRVLRPPSAELVKGALWTAEHIAEVPALGWEVFLEVAQWEPAQVAAKLVSHCSRCAELGPRTPMNRASGLFTSTLSEEATQRLAVFWTHKSGQLENQGANSTPASYSPVVRKVLHKHYTKKDVLEWLGSQADQLNQKGGLDFVEVWTGQARISSSVAARGGTAVKIGLQHGHDLRRLRDRELLMRFLDGWPPKEVWCSFPCTAFCCWVAINEARGCDMEQVKKEGLLHVSFAKLIMAHCRERGINCTVENPLLSRAWRLLEDELKEPGWQQVRLDQCMVDLRSPDGHLHLKPTRIATRSADIARALARRCDGAHDHERIGGQATKASESYSQAMGDLVAHTIMKDKHEGGGAADTEPGDEPTAGNHSTSHPHQAAGTTTSGVVDRGTGRRLVAGVGGPGGWLLPVVPRSAPPLQAAGTTQAIDEEGGAADTEPGDGAATADTEPTREAAGQKTPRLAGQEATGPTVGGRSSPVVTGRESAADRLTCDAQAASRLGAAEGDKRAGNVFSVGIRREGELKGAEDYLSYLAGNPEYQPELVAGLVELGDSLLKLAGSLTSAAAAIGTVWWELHGNHLKGVFDAKLDDLVDEKLLRYIRSVATDGVRSRYQGPRARRKAMPHQSAQEHLPELMASLWKDAAKARVLICSGASEDLLKEVVSVPMARVPKQNPDRTVSEEGRLIWDGTYPNTFCGKRDHPPADQPKHEELIREILYWKLRFPGVPVLLSKKDIKDAFRWLPYHPADVHTFGADISGKQWGVGKAITVVYLVLTFGWTGSPGEWMAWAWAMKEYHAAHAPETARWEDVVAFHSHFLMDDQVLVEPDIGLRAHQSGKVAIEGIRALMGENALNERKEQEEGKMETVKLCWGLLYDTEKEQVSMPEPKVEKANYLLADTEFDYGCEKVSMKLLEQYRGNQQYWAIVIPCMRHLLGTTDAMMRGGGRCGYAHPGVCSSTRAQTFQDFWENVELARILVSDRKKWSSRFVGAMRGVLTVNERLALPGCPEVIWVTGDATLDRIATVDWSSKRVAVHKVAEFWAPLAEAMGAAADEEAIIAVAELLNFVTYAAWAGPEGLWRGRVVMYTGDNMNVHCWLSSRRCKNRYASFALQLLCALEAAYGFETFSAFFRTYHNVTADAFTRQAKEELEALIQQHNLKPVDLHRAWRDHLDRGWMRRALVWDGQENDDRKAALQLAERRGPRGDIPRQVLDGGPSMSPGAGLKVVEWRGTLGNLAKAAARSGANAWMLSAPKGPLEGCAAWPAGVQEAPDVEGFFDVVVAALTDDRGEEAKRWALFVIRHAAKVAVADAPRTADLRPAKEELMRAGYQWVVSEVEATSFGDGTARRRNLVAVAKIEKLEEKVQQWMAERLARAQPPRKARDFLVRPGSASAAVAIAAADGVMQEDPRMPRLGGQTGPRPCGHITIAGKRHVVYDTSYPLPSLRTASVSPGAEGSVFLLETTSKSGARALLPEEVWRAHGGDGATWQRARQDGCDEEQLLMWALRTSPPELAQMEVALAMKLAEGRVGGRAGVCSLKHEERSRGRMMAWLEAWAHHPGRPGEATPKEVKPDAGEKFWLEGASDEDRRAGALDEEPARDELRDFTKMWAGAEAGWLTRALSHCVDGHERRAGGGPRRPRATAAGPANLKGPEAIMRNGCAPVTPTALNTREKWDQAKLQLVLDKLADGTKKTYSIGWRWWALFCRVRGEAPLRKVTHDRVQVEEEMFLDFVVHLAEHGSKAVGTIKQYLSAIRAQHLALGYPDPTGPMGRLWMAIDGLKRRQGGPARKRPVTPKMLRWIGAGMKPERTYDEAMLWAATLTAYFFLLRASEYTSPDQTGHDTGKGLRGQDVVFKQDGNITQAYSQADEVVICIRGSKTDQLNRGEYRNHHKVPDEQFLESKLCVVRALTGYARWAPERFGGAKRTEQLFAWADGKFLMRHQIHSLVAKSAVAEGLSYDDISSHSLRIGGASALWAKYQDSALVQRWGRWRSDAFHGYLWDTREAARGIATGMGMADLTAV